MTAAILDVDGTLVDTNYHHAIAWWRAFKQHDLIIPIWKVHRHIGMGGDQLVAALSGDATEKELGDAIREAEKKEYQELIDEVVLMAESRDLIIDLKARGHVVILASSAKKEEIDHYLDLLDARGLVDDWTTSADVDKTKPHPDLVLAALEKAQSEDGVMVGDSTFDCRAAKNAGIQTIAVLTGGFSIQELEEAGAAVVFESVAELRKQLDHTALR
jgi:HAD superfamily hydrolase (TIGR01549 family)